MASACFYAVRRGRVPGIYTSWAEAATQVLGTTGAQHKKFSTREAASAWLLGRTANVPINPPATVHALLKQHRPHRARAQKIYAPPSDAVVPPGAMVVYADGACKYNGQPGARAGIGIYVGPDDARNVSERLDPKVYRPTNQARAL
jgi:ribonuclease HI